MRAKRIGDAAKAQRLYENHIRKQGDPPWSKLPHSKKHADVEHYEEKYIDMVRELDV